MSADEPIKFRAAKSGLSIADWLAIRTRRDSTVYAGAAVLLAVCAFFAFFATYLFAFLVVAGMNAAIGGPLVGWLRHPPALALVYALFELQKKVDGDDLEPVIVDAGSRGEVTLRLSRLTGSSWLMHLDNPSSDLSPLVRMPINVLLIASRLTRLCRRMWRLSRQIRTMDVAGVGAALDALMQTGGRTAIGELLQEFPNQDPQTLVSDLTTLDGVILLASDPPGLTLTPSMNEDFEDWKKEVRRRRRSGNV